MKGASLVLRQYIVLSCETAEKLGKRWIWPQFFLFGSRELFLESSLTFASPLVVLEKIHVIKFPMKKHVSSPNAFKLTESHIPVPGTLMG